MERKLITSILISLVFIFLGDASVAQSTLTLRNPSFEDIPHAGGLNSNSTIKDWFDCSRINFPFTTPPDIHAGATRDTAFWDMTVATAHGVTFLGMVVRDNESWESIAQRLQGPLRAGKCYEFSTYLARSDVYRSPTMSNLAKDVDFTTPAVLRVWGGSGYCGPEQLLGESKPVDHSEWREYVFQFEPNDDYDFIMLEAFYQTPVLFPYNGHVLVDNSSKIVEIECKQDYEVYVRNRVDKTVKRKKMPAHKAKAKKQEVFKRERKENKIDTIVYKRPSSNELNLDRSKIKKGQKFRIPKLFFEADTSEITDKSYSVLNELYDFLDENKDIRIEVGGHTNGVPPSHEWCDELSESRAKSVTEYLVLRGIEEGRIEYKGYGKRKPIASNFTPAGRKQNQRVEIRILSINTDG